MTYQSQAANHPPRPTSVEIHLLTSTIKYMDCLAEDGLEEISSIAQLALASLENPDGYRQTANIANALKSIWLKADLALGHIKCEAEAVGCASTDDAKHRRLNAMRIHQQATGA